MAKHLTPLHIRGITGYYPTMKNSAKSGLKSRHIAMLIALSLTLSACGGLGYTPPPGAKLGDAFLALTVSTSDRTRMPKGADVVISIEDATATGKDAVLIGDVVKLSQADPDVKVNFPVDRHKLADCGKTKVCRITVKVVKDGSLRYNSVNARPYKAGETTAVIAVSRVR